MTSLAGLALARSAAGAPQSVCRGGGSYLMRRR